MNPEIKLSVEATGRLHVVLSGSLAAISALTLRLNGRAWATLLTTPDVTASATQKLWSCELFAPVEGEVVELVDAHTQALLDLIVLGKREPEAHEVKGYDALMRLHEADPSKLLSDKGDDSDDIRRDLIDRGIEPVVPPRSTRKTSIQI